MSAQHCRSEYPRPDPAIFAVEPSWSKPNYCGRLQNWTRSSIADRGNPSRRRAVSVPRASFRLLSPPERPRSASPDRLAVPLLRRPSARLLRGGQADTLRCWCNAGASQELSRRCRPGEGSSSGIVSTSEETGRAGGTCTGRRHGFPGELRIGREPDSRTDRDRGTGSGSVGWPRRRAASTAASGRRGERVPECGDLGPAISRCLARSGPIARGLRRCRRRAESILPLPLDRSGDGSRETRTRRRPHGVRLVRRLPP